MFLPQINIDKNQIDQVLSTKFLGVLINENLTWSDHISAVLNKTSKNVGIIRKLSKTLPSDILLTLYNTLIAPYLDYCNIAWSSRDTIEFKKLFRVQKKKHCVLLLVEVDKRTRSLYLKTREY